MEDPAIVCANCGSENAAGKRFCGDCGAPLDRACATCGASNPPGKRFCGDCGAQLAPDTSVAPVPTTIPADAARRTDAVADREAERRLVTVLFVDLVGFTPFAEERDAEDVRETLTRYFELAREVIERYGGTVEKFIGDAVMAVWGAPTAHEDDAERAVRAGLDLIDRVASLGPQIRARCGILTGEAAVTLGASGQGLVAGDLVNTAARLQGAAEPGTVLVGEATMRAASAAITFEPAGTHDLKGKASPVRAWRAAQVVAQRGGHRRAGALEPPFVGREDELRLLKDALHATARDRRVRLVSVTGPAGIGKSRLAWELEKYVDGVVEAVYWHRGRSPSYGDGVAFWALGEMVRQRAGLAEGDDPTATRDAVARAVSAFVEDEDDRRWVEPALLALLGVEPAPPGGRDALFAGWRIFFERIARRGTTVLLFEDLHWADTGLLDFIDHLVDWSRSAPILVLTLARPELVERRPEWATGRRHFTGVALDPLSSTVMAELLERMVPGLPAETVRAIVERADGVPLYAVETVRTLVADGRLERSGETYRAVGDLTAIGVPDTLRSLVGARLDALDADERRLLQDASVLGRTFTADALAAIAEQDAALVEERLRWLVRRELLELEADPRSPERGQYGFVQSVIREVAYDTLSRRDRRARHLAAARYFEALGDDELAGVLASHYLAAHRASADGPQADAVAAQARVALRAAADRASALGGHDQVIGYVEQALTITTAPAERGDLLIRASIAALTIVRYEEGARFARAALEAFEAAGDSAGSARATSALGRAFIESGRQGEAIDVLETAIANLRAELRRGPAEANLLTGLSRALMRAADYARTIEVADAALAIAEPLNLEPLVAEALVNKASALDFIGRPREAGALMLAAIDAAREHGWIATQLRAMNNHATSIAAEDPRAAVALTREALALARKVGDRTHALWLAGSAAYFSFAAGFEWDTAIRDVDAVMPFASGPVDTGRLLSLRGMILVARGAPASSLVSDLEVVGMIDDAQAQVGDHWIRAEIGFVTGDFEASVREAVRAVEIIPEYGPSILPLAILGAHAGGQDRELRELVGRLDGIRYGDRMTEAYRVRAHSVLDALEGRLDDAAAGFRAAWSTMADLGYEFERARGVLHVILGLGADHPEARRFADESLEILSRLEAQPYVDRVEALLREGSPRRVGPERSLARAP